jgi:hypothetical protein
MIILEYSEDRSSPNVTDVSPDVAAGLPESAKISA